MAAFSGEWGARDVSFESTHGLQVLRLGAVLHPCLSEESAGTLMRGRVRVKTWRRSHRGRRPMRPGESALLLVGHGSHLSGGSSAPIRDLAVRLVAAGAFTEVRVAFWKEEPSLRHAFDLIENRDVFVVPVFTSEGYFTEQVLPRELGLAADGDRPKGLNIRWCPPVGTHPGMRDLALLRIAEIAPADSEGETALVVVGHGTGLHPRSGETTEALVAALRAQGRYREVVPAFLDQEPELEAVLAGVDSADAIVLPFFIAEGWHAGTTIPRDLALSGGESRVGGTRVRYAKPIGTHPGMVDIVVSLVLEAARADVGTRAEAETEVGTRAEAELEAGTRAEDGPGLAEGGTPGAWAKTRFIEGLRSLDADGVTFLQLLIRPDMDGGYEIRHTKDAGYDSTTLRDGVGALDAEALAATTADGTHRALRTAPDLPRGWRFGGLSPADVWELLTHFYPGAAAQREFAHEGALRIASWDETASRQTGIYAGLERLPRDQVLELVEGRCARGCLRIPVWSPAGPPVGLPQGAAAETPAGKPAGAPLEARAVRPSAAWAGGDVPCPEPCSLLITDAKHLTSRGTRGAAGGSGVDASQT